MTRDQYQQLVKNSEIFLLMNDEQQQTILDAEGVEMEEYARMFEGSDAFLAEKKDEMVESNEKAFREMKIEAQEVVKDKIRSEEARAQKEETAKGEALLEELSDT